MTIARPKKKSRGGLQLRTKILLVAILALFITLVVGVRFVNRDTVLLFADEYDALLDKRQDEDNNAYFILVKAIDALPPRPVPKALPDKERPEFNTLYTPDRHNMGEFAGIARPDDHPEFLQLLIDAKPAFDIAHTMLEKDYFVFRFPTVNSRRSLSFPSQADADPLFTTWIAYANAQALFWDKSLQTIDTFTQIHEVMKLHSTESINRFDGNRGWIAAWDAYYLTLLNIVRKSDDTKLILAIDAMLEQQTLPYDDMQRVLHNELHILDETLICSETMAKLGRKFRVNIDDQFSFFWSFRTSSTSCASNSRPWKNSSNNQSRNKVNGWTTQDGQKSPMPTTPTPTTRSTS